MVDTGSSTTSLNADDLREVDLGVIGPKEPVGLGYGGLLLGYRLPGMVQFDEPSVGTHGYQVDLLLFDDPELIGLPSVIGRDILVYWRMVHDPLNERLEFETWESHDFVPR